MTQENTEQKMPRYIFINFKKDGNQVKAVLADFLILETINSKGNNKLGLNFNLDELTEVTYQEVLKLGKDGEVYGFPSDMNNFNPADYILHSNELRIILDLHELTKRVHYVVFVDYRGTLYVLPALTFKYLTELGGYVLKSSTIRYTGKSLKLKTKYQRLTSDILLKNNVSYKIFMDGMAPACYLSYISRVEKSFEHFGIGISHSVIEPPLLCSYVGYFEALAGIQKILTYILQHIEIGNQEYKEIYAKYDAGRKKYADTPEANKQTKLSKISTALSSLLEGIYSKNSNTTNLAEDISNILIPVFIQNIQDIELAYTRDELFPIRYYPADTDNRREKHRLSMIAIDKQAFFCDYYDIKSNYRDAIDTNYDRATDEFLIPVTVNGFIGKRDFKAVLRINLDIPDKFKVAEVSFLEESHRYTYQDFDKPTYEELLTKAGVYDTWDSESTASFSSEPYDTNGYIARDVNSFVTGNIDGLKNLFRQFGIVMKSGKGLDDIMYITNSIGAFNDDVVLEVQKHILSHNEYKHFPAKLQVYKKGKLQQSLYIDEEYLNTDRLNDPIKNIMSIVDTSQSHTMYTMGWDGKYALQHLVERTDKREFLRHPYPKECFTDTAPKKANRLHLGILMPVQLPVLYWIVEGVRWYADTVFNGYYGDGYCNFGTGVVICASEDLKKLKEIRNLIKLDRRQLMSAYEVEGSMHYNEFEYLNSYRDLSNGTGDTADVSYIITRRIQGYDVDLTKIYPDKAAQGIFEGVLY